MRKRTGSIWEYLKSIPDLLEKGDTGEIAAARQEYWRIKNRQYQAARRVKGKEVKICLTSKEWQILANSAKQHHTSVSGFTKQASLAYINQTYVVPDIIRIKKMEALLLRSLTAMERIATKEKKGWLTKPNDYDELKAVVYDLQSSLKKELQEPSLLLSVIAAHPEVWEDIKKIIR